SNFSGHSAHISPAPAQPMPTPGRPGSRGGSSISGGAGDVVLVGAAGLPVGTGTDTGAPGTGTGRTSGVCWLGRTPGLVVVGAVPCGTAREWAGVTGTLGCGAPGFAAVSDVHWPVAGSAPMSSNEPEVIW